jgi:peptidoglycan/xylan/chitin deacetylase (PgdA/CDA1 family)
MSDSRRLRVAFLLGADNASSRLAIEAVCSLADVQPVAILLDTDRATLGRRIKNFRKNIRKEGWLYGTRRIMEALRVLTDRLVERAPVSGESVREVLHAAFPDRCFSLADLARKFEFEVSPIGNINGPEAVRKLREADVDLGIVLGTRILKEPIFSVPRLGCINLHKGKVPEYRGMPPGFWELYDRVPTAGVTVHFVDKGLDTGDVVAAAQIPIETTDTPDSLLQKLHEEGARTLVSAVKAIQAGSADRKKQENTKQKARTKPTFAEVQELRKRLPRWRKPSDTAVLAKNLYSLLLYYSGVYWLARAWHRLSHARGCILLYHRVNDYSKDVLTVDPHTFAAQLLAMGKRYRSASTSDMVQLLRTRQKIPPTTIAIHFDDCYRDIFLNGAPILKAAGFQACAFVSSGFVDTDRAFAHDREKYPFRYPNLRTEDLRAWAASGFEVGVHTVNHVDLGKCSLPEAHFEVTESGAQLRSILNGNGGAGTHERTEIAYFSFPFGRIHNIRPEVVEMIRQAGYQAVFSAYGGFVGARTDLFDVPRMGCSWEIRPLYLLLEIEGLGPGQLAARLRKMLRR